MWIHLWGRGSLWRVQDGEAGAGGEVPQADQRTTPLLRRGQQTAIATESQRADVVCVSQKEPAIQNKAQSAA